MKLINHLKRIEVLDAEMAVRATESIVKILQLMRVAEYERFEFPDKPYGCYGIASNIASVCYMPVSMDGGEPYAVIYNTKERWYDSGARDGDMLCSIQSRLRPIFRRYVREHPETPRQYARKVEDLGRKYYWAMADIENDAGADIIRMLIEMGVRPGENFKMPDVTRPKGHEDGIFKVSYFRGRHTLGSVYSLDGNEYNIGYNYYTYDEWVSNYGELCGADSAAALCGRVAKAYRKYLKAKKSV